jgi:hypothetical protein
MSDGKAFNIDLGRLKSREKDSSPQAIEKAERAGEELGFVPRDGQKTARAETQPTHRASACQGAARHLR